MISFSAAKHIIPTFLKKSKLTLTEKAKIKHEKYIFKYIFKYKHNYLFIIEISALSGYAIYFDK